MQPTVSIAESSHRNEQNGQNMSKPKVNKENFNQSPILFFVEVGNEEVLNFLHLHEAFAHFEDHTQPKVFSEAKTIPDVDNQDPQAYHIHNKLFFHVVQPNILEY